MGTAPCADRFPFHPAASRQLERRVERIVKTNDIQLRLLESICKLMRLPFKPITCDCWDAGEVVSIFICDVCPGFYRFLQHVALVFLLLLLYCWRWWSCLGSAFLSMRQFISRAPVFSFCMEAVEASLMTGSYFNSHEIELCHSFTRSNGATVFSRNVLSSHPLEIARFYG